jgi:hypothetical protein
MSIIEAGQLWVSDGRPTGGEPQTYYIAKVFEGVCFAVPVHISGTRKGAKVVADGKVRRFPVSHILEWWMPTGTPVQVPRTWHEQLLDACDEP